MDSFLSRYRNLTVLLLVITAQLLLLAWQVRTDQDVRLIRVWSVTAVTPLARILEAVRSNTLGVAEDYLALHNVKEQNRDLKKQLDQFKLQNQFLRTQLETADRARALTAFQKQTPSRTVAARIIGSGTGSSSSAVFVDRGSAEGAQLNMAVITADGIVGKVVAAYPTASLVLLVTDPSFAAGVISQKHRVHGTLKGTGTGTCKVTYIQNEEKVDVGEWFFTSGEDRIFPKGLQAGRVNVVRNGNTFKEVFLVPSRLQGGLEEVLIVLEGVHQPVPEGEASAQTYSLLPSPPEESKAETAPASASSFSTDADKLLEKYREVGAAQGHKFGEGLPGSKPPDFNLSLPPKPAEPGLQPPASPQQQQPSAPGEKKERVPPPAAGAKSSTPPSQ